MDKTKRKILIQQSKCFQKNEEIANRGIYDGDVEAIASGIFGVTCSSLIYIDK